MCVCVCERVWVCICVRVSRRTARWARSMALAGAHTCVCVSQCEWVSECVCVCVWALKWVISMPGQGILWRQQVHTCVCLNMRECVCIYALKWVIRWLTMNGVRMSGVLWMTQMMVNVYMFITYIYAPQDAIHRRLYALKWVIRWLIWVIHRTPFIGAYQWRPVAPAGVFELSI